MFRCYCCCLFFFSSGATAKTRSTHAVPVRLRQVCSPRSAENSALRVMAFGRTSTASDPSVLRPRHACRKASTAGRGAPGTPLNAKRRRVVDGTKHADRHSRRIKIFCAKRMRIKKRGFCVYLYQKSFSGSAFYSSNFVVSTFCSVVSTRKIACKTNATPYPARPPFYRLST